MKFKNTALLLTAALSLGLAIQSCGKKEDPPVTAKTLDKAKLYDKRWYSSGSTYQHLFKTGGIYEGDGTWKWINNSDTMEIVYSDGLPPVKWKFYWSADHEMACSIVGAANEAIYKDAPW